MVRQRKEKWRKAAPEVDRALEKRAAEAALQDRDDLFTVDTTGPPHCRTRGSQRTDANAPTANLELKRRGYFTFLFSANELSLPFLVL